MAHFLAPLERELGAASRRWQGSIRELPAAGVVYLMIGFRGNALLAIPLASASGDITDSDAIAWSLDRAGRCWWDDGVFTAEGKSR